MARPRLLDLCGGTGAWSRPYLAADYEVIVVENDPRLTCTPIDIRTYEPPANVHGILAAPPCTMFSFARQTAKTPRDFASAMELVDACLHIIWQCRAEGSLAWWAMENPVGYLRQFLGKPTMTFKPCDYGDPYTKRTDVWGYFSEPKKAPIQVAKEADGTHDFGTNRGYSFARHGRDGLTRQHVRGITPAGFAHAFFEANP